MPFHSISINVSSEVDAGYVSDILFELGALSVTVSDRNAHTPDEQPIFGEPLPSADYEMNAKKYWKESVITSLHPMSCDIEHLIMLIATQFELPTTPSFIKKELFDEKDPQHWIQKCIDSFKPIIIDRIRISFPWHDKDPNYHNIRLDPGMAFGTGEHQTTQLCLSWLQQAVNPTTKMLDYGTGTGILSIAAAMLVDDISITAVDIDPVAVRIAETNAVENDVEHKIAFFENDEEPVDKHDIVVANILAPPLKKLAPLLVERMRKGATIALSGILTSQAVDVSECYSKLGVSFGNSTVRDEWVLLVGTLA